jgi:uncharacterized protein (DUF983 family)
MYCSSCGVAVAQGLTYCKNCGAKLNSGDRADKQPDVSPGGLVTMMVATFVMGTVVITMLMGVMKVIVQFDLGLIIGFAGLSFLIMLVLEGIFIHLLFRRRRDDERRETRQNDRVTTKELEAQSRLPIEPIPSVTEHTTRAFDPVYTERK